MQNRTADNSIIIARGSLSWRRTTDFFVPASLLFPGPRNFVDSRKFLTPFTLYSSNKTNEKFRVYCRVRSTPRGQLSDRTFPRTPDPSRFLIPPLVFHSLSRLLPV